MFLQIWQIQRSCWSENPLCALLYGHVELDAKSTGSLQTWEYVGVTKWILLCFRIAFSVFSFFCDLQAALAHCDISLVLGEVWRWDRDQWPILWISGHWSRVSTWCGASLRLRRLSCLMPRIRVVWTSRQALASKHYHVTGRFMMIDVWCRYLLVQQFLLAVCPWRMTWRRHFDTFSIIFPIWLKVVMKCFVLTEVKWQI